MPRTQIDEDMEILIGAGAMAPVAAVRMEIRIKMEASAPAAGTGTVPLAASERRTPGYAPYTPQPNNPPFVANGGLPRGPPPQQEFDLDAFISHQLSSLGIGNGNLHRCVPMAVLGNERRRQQERRVTEESSNGRFHAGVGLVYHNRSPRRGVLGRFEHLRSLLRELGADVVGYVFHEVAGDLVGLMGHPVGAGLVNDMAGLWTDEQVASVLRTLGASFPRDIMSAARNHEGSSVLQKLIRRIRGSREQMESLARSLAGVGDHNVLALIKDAAGTQVINECLDAFPPAYTQFIFRVVMGHPYDVSCNRHGCQTMKLCISTAGDLETIRKLVGAVCEYGLELAQDSYGNYVVQFLIAKVPGTRLWLHAAFWGSYVSLARQKASSNVVEQCLYSFPEDWSKEIMYELLADQRFPELIADPYANYYILQSVIRLLERAKDPLLRRVAGAVRPYKNLLWDDCHSRKLLQMLKRYF